MAASSGSRTFCLLLLQLAVTLTHFVVQCKAEHGTLRQAHIIFRHGFRSPISGYPKDKIKEDQWPQGFGQLTERGMKQHQDLGAWLHKRYMVENTLLNATYNRSEIWIRSSAYDRTIMSAQSCLSGLFKLEKKNNLGLLWRPIPVWTEKITSDYMMSPWHCPCPRFETLEKARYENPEIQAYMDENKQFLKSLRGYTGLPENSTFLNYTRVVDTIIMEIGDNRALNEWARNETVYGQLKAMQDTQIRFMYSNQSAEETSIFSGELLKEISHSFQDIVVNSKHHQAHIFSGHDTTLSPLLYALTSEEIWENPTPASCILLELYEKDKKFSVEMHYRNGTDEKDRPLQIKTCSLDSSCPLEQFQKLVKQFIPEDIKKTCHYVPAGSSPSGNFIITIVIISTIVVFLSIIICLIKGSKGRAHLFKKQSRFEPINFQLLGNPGSDSEDADVFDIKTQ